MIYTSRDETNVTKYGFTETQQDKEDKALLRTDLVKNEQLKKLKDYFLKE